MARNAGRIAALMPSFGAICMLISLATLLHLGFSQFASDPGVGWHLKTGELIVEQGIIPRADPFLASPEPRRWVSDQWLADAVLYLVFRTGSWPLLYAVLAALYMLTFWGVLYRGLVRCSGFKILSALATVYSFKAAQVHFILRPVMFSFLFFVLLYVQLARRYGLFLRSGEPLVTRGLWFGLPLLFALWANVHPAFAAGLILSCLLPAGVLLDWMLGRIEWRRCRAGLLQVLGLLAACAAATVINPYGWQLHESILSLAGSDYFMQLHQEWLGPVFRSVEGKFFEYGTLFLICSFFIARPQKQSLGAYHFLLVVTFAHLTLQAVRMLPFFGIVASLPMVAAAAGLADVLRRLERPRADWYLRRLQAIEALEQKLLPPLFPLLCLAAGLVAYAGSTGALPLFPGPFGPPPNRYPFGAVQALRERAAGAAAPVTVAAEPTWGGFITFYGAPLARPAIDDRNTMLGEGVYRQFYKALSPGGDWRGYVKGVGARYLLLAKGCALATLLRGEPAVTVVFEDQLSVLYEVVE